MRVSKKVITLLAFIILFIIINTTKVNAASASISSSKTSMKVGETATIRVSYTAAAWSIRVSGAVSYSSADTSSDAKNTSKSVSLKFKPSKAGTYRVSLSGDVTDGNSGATKYLSSSITIKVKEKSSSNNSSSNNNSNNNNSNSDNSNNTNNDSTDNEKQKVSSDATLSNLGITPNDFSGFRKAITQYSVTVPKNVANISIYATPSNSKARVTGTGSKALKEGKNNFAIRVTAEDKKTTKTYNITITRKSEEEVSDDATLQNLGIRPKEYDFTGFRPGNTNYTVEVPNDVDKVTIYAYASNEKATVTGTGSKSLQVGKNSCSVRVTAEDKKTSKIYNLSITRKEKEEEPEEEKENDKNTTTAGITNIQIEGYNLEPSFDQEVYEYEVSVPKGTTSLDIKTEKTSKDIDVEIAGNEDLKDGENVITILVHNKKDDSTTTYQITATVGDDVIDVTKVNSEMHQYRASIKKQQWGVKFTIALIIFLTIVFFVQRHRLMNDYYEEDTNSEAFDAGTGNIYDVRKDFSSPEDEEETFKRSGRYKGKRFK